MRKKTVRLLTRGLESSTAKRKLKKWYNKLSWPHKATVCKILRDKEAAGHAESNDTNNK